MSNWDLTYFNILLIIVEDMTKTKKRISRRWKPVRELPDGARQEAEALNSPRSSSVEGHGDSSQAGQAEAGVPVTESMSAFGVCGYSRAKKSGTTEFSLFVSCEIEKAFLCAARGDENTALQSARAR